MKTSRRMLTVTATTLALAFAVAACSDTGSADPGAPDDGAEETDEDADGADDGSLVLYSGRDEGLVQPLIDEFVAESGIEVEVRYGSTGEMASQLAEEGSSTPAQAFLAQDAGGLGAVADEGLFVTLPDEILDRVPAAYSAQEGDWVGLSGRARVLVYSEASVDPGDLPNSVFELTEPEWNGRVGVAPTNASFQSFVTAMRVEHGDDAALEWLEGIAANAPVIHDGNGGIVGDVEADALDVGLVNHYYLHGTAAEAGIAPEELNVTLHFFDDGDVGGLLNVAGIGLINEVTDEGLAFIEFLLSDHGQQYFSDETGEYPVVAGVPEPDWLPSLEELEIPEINLNDLGDLQTTVDLISSAGLA